MIFFVISGYSITASISNLMTQTNPITEYFRKRFCRVMPPLIVSIVLMYLLYELAPYYFTSGSNEFINELNLPRKGLYFDFRQILGAVLFLNGFFTITPNSNGPLWSLSYEVWLYVLFFAIYYAINKNQKMWLVFGLVLYAKLIFSDTTGQYYFFKYSLIWLLGAGCRLVFQYDYVGLIRFTWLIKLFFLAALLTTLLVGYRYIEVRMKMDISPFNLCVGVTFFSYLLLGGGKKNRSNDYPFTFHWVKSAADFSYTLYLVHFPVYLFAFGIAQQRLGPSYFILPCGVYLLTIGLAYTLALFAENRNFYINLLRTPK